MKVLITIMFLMAGCGLDPDDYRMQEADGCPSSGCQEEPVAEPEPEPEPAEPEELVEQEEPVECKEGKLCKGMTMEQVLAVTGDPQTIENARYMMHKLVLWKWTELEGEQKFCRVTSIWDNSCHLEFRKGKLWTTKDFLAEHLDPLSFDR
jgi:hypothetical protein